MDTYSIQTIWNVLVAGLEVMLPSMALYLLARQVLDRGDRTHLTHAPLFGIGLGVAVWPLLLLFTTLVGLHFSPLAAWALLLVCAAYVAWRILSLGGLRVTRRQVWAGLSLVAMCALALGFRLGDVQGLAVPMFGDSLHHTMVTNLILNTGQVPANYEPYVPVETFTYHFGFHTLAAVLAMLTGLSAPQAVLLMGQVLITAALPVAYLLNRTLFGSRAAGLCAALITGFVSIMPAFYVNWGRYTQLAGHILVVVALIFTARLMGPNWRRSDLALTAVCVAGLVVVHYRVLIFYGLFGVALGAWQIFEQIRGRTERRALIAGWGRGLAAVLLGLALTATWLVNLFTNYFPTLLGRLRTVTPDYLAGYNNPDSVRLFLGAAMPLLAVVGLVVGITSLMRRGRPVEGREADAKLSPGGAAVVMALWAGLLVFSLWPVPGAIGGYAVAISMYIPLAALGGYGLGWIVEWLVRRLRLPDWAPAAALPLVAIVAALLTGTWHMIDPGRHSYVQWPDLEAFAWIKANTPADAKFLISSEFSYQGRGLTGTDAGMWLPLLAQRNVSVPALSTWVERPEDPDFFTNTRRLAAYTQPVGKPGEAGDSLQVNIAARGEIPAPASVTSPQALSLMRDLGITYVYSGAMQGHSTPRLDVEAMRGDPVHFRLVYFRDGVYVFEVVQ